jgi:hypothetical protein
MMRRAPQEIRTFFVTSVTWQRRPLFRAEPIARHAVYLRNNPVRAHLAENAAAYPYGSAAGGIPIDIPPPGLKPPIVNGDYSPD